LLKLDGNDYAGGSAEKAAASVQRLKLSDEAAEAGGDRHRRHPGKDAGDAGFFLRESRSLSGTSSLIPIHKSRCLHGFCC